MNKSEFLAALSGALAGIPGTENAAAYYGEMIDDRVEEGMSEEEAVAGLDTVETIRRRFIDEAPLPQIIETKTGKPLSGCAIVLIVLGFPVWFPLFIAAAAVIFSFYVVVGALMLSVFAVILALAVGGVMYIVVGVCHISVDPAYMFFSVGCGLFLVGTFLLLLRPSLFAGRRLWEFTKLAGRKCKQLLFRRKVTGHEG